MREHVRIVKAPAGPLQPMAAETTSAWHTSAFGLKVGEARGEETKP